jgi:hypothetical protein
MKRITSIQRRIKQILLSQKEILPLFFFIEIALKKNYWKKRRKWNFSVILKHFNAEVEEEFLVVNKKPKYSLNLFFIETRSCLKNVGSVSFSKSLLE